MVLIELHDKSVPKKSKIKVRAPTQDELIARALDMEEGNIVEHKNYLFVEEEKRKQAHAVRATISGPLLRWISRDETVTVPNVDASQPAYPLNSRTEEVSKNYIVHETSQDETATRPPWKDTMAAMFGDHVKWEDMKAYVSRGRPLCKLRIPYRIFESEELYSSTRAAMFHNGPSCTIRRSPYQCTLRYTSSLSYTHDDFEPRICLESRTWLLSNHPGKFHSFHDSRWICADQ
jgi:YL1 nuclear protein